MNVKHFEQVNSATVTMEGAKGCTVRWLVGEPEGAPTFAMRHFEVEPGGFTPKHSHPYEHEVFILQGHGVVLEGNDEHRLAPGVVVLVKPDEVHQFRNTDSTPLTFLCLIPNSAIGKQVTVAPECGCG